MNLVDIVIIIFLLFGALIGLKRGLTRQLVSLIGLVLIVVLSFVFKNSVSMLLYSNLPFFDFSGKLAGVTVINLLIYEVIAFLLILLILAVLLKFVVFASNIFEKILDMTIILGIPSKILGALVGVLEKFVMAFIVLYILSLPGLNIKIVEESSFRSGILTKTPILNKYTNSMFEIGKEFSTILEKYKNSTDPSKLNLESLDLLLKHKVVTVESVDTLVGKNKLQINDIESILIKYRK